MMLFTYRADNQIANEAQVTKDGLDRVSYLIEFADGVMSGASISTVATVATDSTGATVTSNCVLSTANSGTQTTVITLTMGASSGTLAPADGSRFRLRTTATLNSTNGVLIYDVFFYVRSKSYLPT